MTEEESTQTKWIKALVYLQSMQFLDDETKARPELVLSRAGLTNKEIADMLDKKVDAVAKTIQRARQKESSRGKKG